MSEKIKMSAAKKRAVSQCDDHECESDEPAIKVIKLNSLIFSITYGWHLRQF